MTNAKETRIFSLPMKSEYAIVSMPGTAWYWLDDLVRRDYPDGYAALVNKAFKASGGRSSALSAALEARAQDHCDRQMGRLYSLSNDNTTPPGQKLAANPSHPRMPKLSGAMPSVYRLFHFMPHPTYLTTVWERRNFLRGRGPL